MRQAQKDETGIREALQALDGILLVDVSSTAAILKTLLKSRKNLVLWDGVLFHHREVDSQDTVRTCSQVDYA